VNESSSERTHNEFIMRCLPGGGSQRKPTEERGLDFFVCRHSRALPGVLGGVEVASPLKG